MVKIGTVLGGKYEILKQIGRGGMSIVYVAMDIRLNKRWAVKEIKEEGNRNRQALLKGLKIEANILKQADHPVLPRIVDVIDFEGKIFVVMDYIEGRTLSEILKRDGAQPQEQVIEWAKDLCGALQYLHSMNPPVIYRDMKPSNIMVKPDGNVKLIDFGAAKEQCIEKMADTTVLGTRGYAAPEQFGDEEGHGIYRTDERTDIYSLGATLYHVLTGKNPGEPPYEIKPICEWNPELSKGLEKIICKCTMPDPAKRYSSCEELLYDLEHYKELDDAYQRAHLKKKMPFLLCGLLIFCLGAAAVTGYVGKKREQKRNYDDLIVQGCHCVAKGKYQEAAALYTDAITNVDSSRSEAYLELLNLYIYYLDAPEAGLAKMADYIDRGYGGMDKDQRLIFAVAMGYFDVQRDYRTSAFYFDILDRERYPAAPYYSAVALAMSDLNVDYETLLSKLLLFEKENDESGNFENKLMNYKLLCVVYARCLNRMNNADEHLVTVAEKGLELLDGYEGESIKAEYYAIYYQYMAQGYASMGRRFMESDTERGTAYYEQALSCCSLILEIIPKTDGDTIGSISDASLREAKYCQKAEILTALGQYEEACQTYEKAEEEYAYSSISLYVGHLTLLCRMEEQVTTDVAQWDYVKINALYEEGAKVPQMAEDYRWRQLTVKLAPLFEGKGK